MTALQCLPRILNPQINVDRQTRGTRVSRGAQPDGLCVPSTASALVLPALLAPPAPVFRLEGSCGVPHLRAGVKGLAGAVPQEPVAGVVTAPLEVRGLAEAAWGRWLGLRKHIGDDLLRPGVELGVGRELAHRGPQNGRCRPRRTGSPGERISAPSVSVAPPARVVRFSGAE